MEIFPCIPKGPKREDFTLNILLEQESLITCQPKRGKTKREAVRILEQLPSAGNNSDRSSPADCRYIGGGCAPTLTGETCSGTAILPGHRPLFHLLPPRPGAGHRKRNN